MGLMGAAFPTNTPCSKLKTCFKQKFKSNFAKNTLFLENI